MRVCPQCGHAAKTLSRVTHSDGRIELLCLSCLAAQKIPSVFQGELMTCCVCGAEERSAAGVGSQWRALQIDERVVYACPEEFPPDGSSAEAFKVAYQIILAAALGADPEQVSRVARMRKEAHA